MTARLLEVCVDGLEGLEAAIAGGADRIELCAALDAGGLTPSAALMASAATCGRPVMAMIRPRSGDFVYSARELELMRRDVDAAGEAGMTGVVLGASRPGGALDGEALATLVEAAGALDLTLHRAFDLVPDVAAAVETAVAAGIGRILTSGGRRSALAGVPGLRQALAAARGRLTIMAGAGIAADSVASLVAAVPELAEIHASCALPLPPDDPAAARLGFVGDRRAPTADSVRALRQALDALGPAPDPARRPGME